LEDFVTKNLIYHVVCGSHSYGLNTPESDIDKKGICIVPKEYLFGLGTFEQQELGADETIYSLHKFVRLAFDCNPNIIEILFTDPQFILFINKYGQLLRDNRHLFLSKRARYSFGGYAIAQLKRIKGHRKWIMFDEKEPKEEDFWITKYRTMPDGTTKSYEKFLEQDYDNALKKWNQYLDWKKNRNPERAKLEEQFSYDCKHAMHLIRLQRMGYEILKNGEVNVFRPDREELLAIRHGQWTYEQVVTYAENMEKELDKLYEVSPLPKKPDYKAIDKLLINMTEEFLEENK
jgi:predicted nucleotidyltransferase